MCRLVPRHSKAQDMVLHQVAALVPAAGLVLVMRLVLMVVTPVLAVMVVRVVTVVSVAAVALVRQAR